MHLLKHFRVACDLGMVSRGGIGFGWGVCTVLRHGARLSLEGTVNGREAGEAYFIPMSLRIVVDVALQVHAPLMVHSAWVR